MPRAYNVIKCKRNLIPCMYNTLINTYYCKGYTINFLKAM